MKKSCDVTDVVKTFRKSTYTGWDGALIPIEIHKINLAGFGVFTECFDNVCDVTRFPPWTVPFQIQWTVFYWKRSFPLLC